MGNHNPLFRGKKKKVYNFIGFVDIKGELKNRKTEKIKKITKKNEP